MSVHVRAPATTANLGAGFDVAGAALDLWNELELSDGAEPADATHLGVRAFSLYASPSGRSFRFVDRIPRERGLGSSAAVVALGLVAGALAAGVEPEVTELLAAGLELEGHADNLAAALAGGVCLTWDGRVERVADTLPGTPIAVIPETHVNTAEARSALPDSVPHADATYSVARATLLGAALAGGRADLFAAAASDLLHEPYREVNAPHLRGIRGELPRGALGATLSGSGPTVIVWAEPDETLQVAAQLAERFPEHTVLPLEVSPLGAGRVP